MAPDRESPLMTSGDAKTTSALDGHRSTEKPTSERTILDACDYDEERHLDQIDLEKADKSRETSREASCASSAAERQAEGKTIVSFTADDPGNPHNWSTGTKLYIVIAGIVLVLNSTIGSSLPAGAAQETAQYFHVEGDAKLVLSTSIYLIGYVLGPIIFSPLSETFGRKIVLIATFFLFTVFTLGCAVAPTFAGLIVFRLLVGVGASTPISVVGGVFADIYREPRARGLAITMFMVATTWGPLVGPIASGYLSVYSWRWTYWFGLIVAGVSWPFLLFMPETYGPTILKRRAKKLRKQHNSSEYVAAAELEKQDLRELVVVVLTRPLRMLFGEAIVLTTSLYLSVIYGIFYMYFQAYPIVFGGIYGFSAGEEGLTFLPIGIGAIVAGAVYLWWDNYLDRAKNKPQPAAWTLQEEYRRLPLACLGGPLFVVALFWLGWTARPSIHWIVPTLSALPFGLAFLLIFMGELNYIVDAYEQYAASAMGATSCSRSLFGVVLPFAAAPMYTNLGVGWACSLLGFLSLLMCITPFVFIKYGDRIRANSKMCRELKEKKARAAAKEEAEAEVVAVADQLTRRPVSADLYDGNGVRNVSHDVEKHG